LRGIDIFPLFLPLEGGGYRWGWKEQGGGGKDIKKLLSPHPNPLPQGEREKIFDITLKNKRRAR